MPREVIDDGYEVVRIDPIVALRRHIHHIRLSYTEHTRPIANGSGNLFVWCKKNVCMVVDRRTRLSKRVFDGF
jgi:hypothetical protein